MSIPATGYAHVRLTVTDIARSRAFYEDVFGFPVAFELPPDADDATKEAMGFPCGARGSLGDLALRSARR